MKKSLLFSLLFLLSIAIISAQATKIDVSTIKESFQPGENITLKVSLYDENNIPINDLVKINLEDAEKRKNIEKIISSNQLIEISLGEMATKGYWNINAEYQTLKSKSIFIVETQEMVKFEIENDVLTITNIGNTQYHKTIQIAIGDTIGIKEPALDIGEKASYRLIAPEGSYSIRITDGQTTVSKENVALTGNVIGVLDKNIGNQAGLTGGIKPEDGNDLSYESLKKSSFTYIFVLAIFGATILIVIERFYRKRTAN